MNRKTKTKKQGNLGTEENAENRRKLQRNSDKHLQRNKRKYYIHETKAVCY